MGEAEGYEVLFGRRKTSCADWGCENGRQWKEYEVCDKMILIEKACMLFVQEL